MGLYLSGVLFWIFHDMNSENSTTRRISQQLHFKHSPEEFKNLVASDGVFDHSVKSGQSVCNVFSFLA